MKLEGLTFSELDFYPIFISRWVEDPDCTLSTPQYIDEPTNSYFEEIESLLRCYSPRSTEVFSM